MTCVNVVDELGVTKKEKTNGKNVYTQSGLTLRACEVLIRHRWDISQDPTAVTGVSHGFLPFIFHVLFCFFLVFSIRKMCTLKSWPN